ncbi:MAG: TonB-dependent receptor plug domain-containing protein [Opitutales bacterium]
MTQLKQFFSRITLSAGLICAPALLNGQADLDPIVITGHRTALPASEQATAANVWSSEDLARLQLTSLQAVLETAPGIDLASSGQTGSITSAFIRGAESDHILLLVDGIRINDPNTDYQVLLGSAGLSGLERLELVRGPMSALYGGEAIGGVIAVQTRIPETTSGGYLTAEAGSLNTYRWEVGGHGDLAGGRFAVSLGTHGTDNERPHNALARESAQFAWERQWGDGWSARLAYRGSRQDYESPGSRFQNDTDNRDLEIQQLVSARVSRQLGDSGEARIIVAHQDRRFRSLDPENSLRTDVVNDRWYLDGQATWRWGGGHQQTIAGFTLEQAATTNTGFGDIDESQDLGAVFVQQLWTVSRDLEVTGAVRQEDYDTFGSETTGRASATWAPLGSDAGWRLKGSIGTGFRSPSFLDLFGQSSFYSGNPDLEPEESVGGDLTVEYRSDLGAYSLVGAVSAFRNDIDNLITFSFLPDFTSTVINLEETRSQGAEVSLLLADPEDSRSLRLAYTWLEAENRQSGQRLLRRPEHNLSALATFRFGAGDRGSLTAGVNWIANREDIDAQTFARIDGEDYTVARLAASWAVNDRLTLTGRIENLFDEAYEEVHGFPARGRSLYAGVDLEF